MKKKANQLTGGDEQKNKKNETKRKTGTGKKTGKDLSIKNFPTFFFQTIWKQFGKKIIQKIFLGTIFPLIFYAKFFSEINFIIFRKTQKNRLKNEKSNITISLTKKGKAP